MLLEHPIDVLDVEGDVLRLAEELLGALDVLLNLLERRVRQVRQILGLVDEALRLVLKRGRAGRGRSKIARSAPVCPPAGLLAFNLIMWRRTARA